MSNRSPEIESALYQLRAKLALLVMACLAALIAHGSDESAIRIVIHHDGGSNDVFSLRFATTNRLSDQPIKRTNVVEMVESNGLYSINIELEPTANKVHPEPPKVERPNDELEPSLNDRVLEISQLLAIYAKLAGAELDIGDGVRDLKDHVSLPSTPAMTRAQVIDMFDEIFLKMGIVAAHPDTKHVVLRLK